MSGDEINHPAHYTFSSIEVIDAIEAWRLPYHLGNVVKYVARAGHKGPALPDLQKARWYLDRYIARATEAKKKRLNLLQKDMDRAFPRVPDDEVPF